MGELKVITLNVNGMNNVIKRKKILLEMAKEKQTVYLRTRHIIARMIQNKEE